MDEKRMVDFCVELNNISNKYRIKLNSGKDGIYLTETDRQIIYTPASPNSATQFPYPILYVCS